MRLEIFSYRFAKEILENPAYVEIYEEITSICKYCPIAQYKDKSKSQAGKDVVQQAMNDYFSVAFEDNGWESEPLVSPGDAEDGLRADFKKEYLVDNIPIRVQIEVEFGNAASSYRNYFKFQLSYSNDMCDVAVLIVPSQHLCTRIDSGVANFEKTVRELPQAKLSVTVPVLVIGLFDVDSAGNALEPWDLESAAGSKDVAKGSKKEDKKKRRELMRQYWLAIKQQTKPAPKQHMLYESLDF